MDVRVENQCDSEKPQNDAKEKFPLQGIVLAQGEYDCNRRHPQGIRVVERHRGAERQVRDGVKPNQKRGGAEDAALEVAPDIGRAKRAPAGNDEAVEHDRGKELAVEDEFVRAERIGAELREGRHQGKEEGCRKHPEASHGTNRGNKNSECAPDGGASSRQTRETKAENKRKTGRSSAPTRRSGRGSRIRTYAWRIQNPLP